MLPPPLNPPFSFVAVGHNLFFRGNRTVPPTHLRSFGRNEKHAVGGANRLGEDEVDDAQVCKYVCVCM